MAISNGQRLSLKGLRHRIWIYLIVLLTSHTWIASSQGPQFYPYGLSVGDNLHPPADDACSLSYRRDISLFEVIYSVLYVCTNGIISLNGTFTGFTPTSFPLQTGVGIIATFWADADLNLGGNLWARETNDTVLLHNVSTVISNSYRTSFTATWAMVVTWEDVEAYGSITSNLTNFYQCVVASDDSLKTYVQYLYGDIDWTFGSASGGVPAQVGFDAGDGINFYAVPGSQTSNISDIGLNSNVGGSGQWLFRLDSATVVIPDMNATFPPSTNAAALSTTAALSTSGTMSTTAALSTTTVPTTTTYPSTVPSTAPTTTTISTVPTSSTATPSASTTTNQPTISQITTTSSSTTSYNQSATTSRETTSHTTGVGPGGSDAQGSVTDNTIASQQATISGSVVGFLFILLATVGLFAFKKWKKNQVHDLWYDAESVIECSSTAPVYHMWPSDLNYGTETKQYHQVEPITGKSLPTGTNSLNAKESFQIVSQPVVPTHHFPDEIVSNAPRNHIWPTELATLITVEPINPEKSRNGIPLTSTTEKTVTFDLLPMSQKQRNSSDAAKMQQQIDSYSGSRTNVVPKAPKKPQFSLPPIKKTASTAKQSERNQQSGAAKSFKQANSLYGKTLKRK